MLEIQPNTKVNLMEFDRNVCCLGICAAVEANAQVLLRYEGNPNGSINDIAGIRNQAGNVYGMMPHPERAVEPHHPCQDGLPVLDAFLEPIRKNNPIELSAS